MESPQPNKKAFYLSHTGLGDNITNLGAVNFLLQYYDTIYFLCRDYYKDNVELIYANKPVIVVPVYTKQSIPPLEPTKICRELLSNVDKNTYDIFVGGVYTSHIKSHITNPNIIHRIRNDKYFLHWQHLYTLYHDNHLDTSIYIDYFDFPSCKMSSFLYEKIAQYRIVFIHSYGIDRGIDVAGIVSRFIYRDDYIIICSDKNVYDLAHPKHDIAEEFVNIKIAYYIDIIRNASYIHIIDSCFSCIVYPLLIAKKIDPKECVIYIRSTGNSQNIQIAYRDSELFIEYVI